MKRFTAVFLLLFALLLLCACKGEAPIDTPPETDDPTEREWNEIIKNDDYSLFIDGKCEPGDKCTVKLSHKDIDYVFEGTCPNTDCALEDSFDITGDGRCDILLSICTDNGDVYKAYAFDGATGEEIFVEDVRLTIPRMIQLFSDAESYGIKIGATVHTLPKSLYKEMVSDEALLSDTPYLGSYVHYSSNSIGLSCSILCYLDDTQLLPIGALSASMVYTDGKLISDSVSFSALPKGETVYYSTNSHDWDFYRNSEYTVLEHKDGRKIKLGDTRISGEHLALLGIPEENDAIIPAYSTSSAYAHISGGYAFIVYENPQYASDNCISHSFIAIDLETGLKCEHISMSEDSILSAHSLTEDILAPYHYKDTEHTPDYRIDASVSEDEGSVKCTFTLMTYDEKIKLTGNVCFDCASGKLAPYEATETVTDTEKSPDTLNLAPITDFSSYSYLAELLEKMASDPDEYSEINKLAIDSAVINIEFNGEGYVATSAEAMGMSYTFPESLPLTGNMQLRAYRAGEAFVLSRLTVTHTAEYGDNWLFTENMVYSVEFPENGEYTDYAYSFHRGYDGQLHYSRAPRKYVPSQFYYDMLNYCTSLSEFCREDGVMTLAEGKLSYSSHKYYTVGDIHYLHSLFIDWLNEAVANDGDTMGIGNGDLPRTLNELLEYNATKYETAH